VTKSHKLQIFFFTEKKELSVQVSAHLEIVLLPAFCAETQRKAGFMRHQIEPADLLDAEIIRTPENLGGSAADVRQGFLQHALRLFRISGCQELPG